METAAVCVNILYLDTRSSDPQTRQSRRVDECFHQAKDVPIKGAFNPVGYGAKSCVQHSGKRLLTDEERRPLPSFTDARDQIYGALREVQRVLQRVGEQPIGIAARGRLTPRRGGGLSLGSNTDNGIDFKPHKYSKPTKQL